jgi:hypothetical protein
MSFSPMSRVLSPHVVAQPLQSGSTASVRFANTTADAPLISDTLRAPVRTLMKEDHAMALIDRVKNICLSPSAEWPVIAQEPASSGALISGYVAPLAAIGAVAGFIGGSIVGRSLLLMSGTYRVPITTGIGMAIFTFVMAIVGVFILSWIINMLAPPFGGEKNSTQALKVAAYSYTPAWVAGALQILPSLGILAILGGFYGLYLLYLGLPVLKRAPKDRAMGYTAVVVLCAIVISVTGTMIGGLALGVSAPGALLNSNNAASSSSGEVQFDKDSTLGRLQQFGKAMEESTRKMEQAEKSGDANAQAAAAMETLGTLFGGGRRVTPLETDQLKVFVPETFAGLPRTHFENEKTGMAGLMISRSQATYGEGDRRVTLEIADPGGATGLVGLASWASVQTSKEDDDGSERTTKVDGRMVHEKTSRRGGDEFAVVIGERFVVNAKGSGVNLAELKSAVSSLDLDKLESMKDVGVQK